MRSSLGPSRFSARSRGSGNRDATGRLEAGRTCGASGECSRRSLLPGGQERERGRLLKRIKVACETRLFDRHRTGQQRGRRTARGTQAALGRVSAAVNLPDMLVLLGRRCEGVVMTMASRRDGVRIQSRVMVRRSGDHRVGRRYGSARGHPCRRDSLEGKGESKNPDDEGQNPAVHRCSLARGEGPLHGGAPAMRSLRQAPAFCLVTPGRQIQGKFRESHLPDAAHGAASSS
jgi:hypothetical protein